MKKNGKWMAPTCLSDPESNASSEIPQIRNFSMHYKTRFAFLINLINYSLKAWGQTLSFHSELKHKETNQVRKGLCFLFFPVGLSPCITGFSWKPPAQALIQCLCISLLLSCSNSSPGLSYTWFTVTLKPLQIWMLLSQWRNTAL